MTWIIGTTKLFSVFFASGNLSGYNLYWGLWIFPIWLSSLNKWLLVLKIVNIFTLLHSMLQMSWICVLLDQIILLYFGLKLVSIELLHEVKYCNITLLLTSHYRKKIEKCWKIQLQNHKPPQKKLINIIVNAK